MWLMDKMIFCEMKEEYEAKITAKTLKYIIKDTIRIKGEKEDAINKR